MEVEKVKKPYRYWVVWVKPIYTIDEAMKSGLATFEGFDSLSGAQVRKLRLGNCEFNVTIFLNMTDEPLTDEERVMYLGEAKRQRTVGNG